MLRPRVTYMIQNANAQGKFLSIATSVNGIDNGMNVYLWDDPNSGYSQWQLELADGYNPSTDSRLPHSTYYASIRHVHSGNYIK